MSARVFMVEDDPLVIGMVRPALEKEGLAFTSHERFEGALETLRPFKPDLVLLDVELPDGDGYAICRSLRNDPAMSDVPVIFLTARGDEISRLKGFEAGGQDYMIKPFSVLELLARVRSHLAVKARRDKLVDAVDELGLRERVRQDISDMIVHDLRSPISTVKITLELLRTSGIVGGTEYDRLLGSAQGALDFMMLTVGDLLDLGAGKVKVEPRTLDLAALAARLNSLVTPHADRRKQKLIIETFGEDGLVTDSALVFRIVANLAFNAIKFSKTGTDITVRLLAFSTGLRAEVIDQGPGVPDAQKEKIFLKYHRTPEAKSGQFEGSGIGLAFCRMAAAALGGKVWVEDAPGGGSRFLLDVPPYSEAHAAAPLFGPETLRAYAEECKDCVRRARELAAKIPGPEAEPAAKELTGIVRKLSGSAPTYGFPDAGLCARAIETLLASRSSAGGALDDKLHEFLLPALQDLEKLLQGS